MSHVVTINMEIKDLTALENVCKRQGWQFRRNQKEYIYWGRFLDDSPIAREVFETEAEYQRVLGMPSEERKAYMNKLYGKCDHAISVPGCKYEVGVLDKGGRYVLAWDYVDYKLCEAMGGSEANTLKKLYAAEKTKLEAQKQGYKVYEEQKQDGSLLLTLSKGAW